MRAALVPAAFAFLRLSIAFSKAAVRTLMSSVKPARSGPSPQHEAAPPQLFRQTHRYACLATVCLPREPLGGWNAEALAKLSGADGSRPPGGALGNLCSSARFSNEYTCGQWYCQPYLAYTRTLHPHLASEPVTACHPAYRGTHVHMLLGLRPTASATNLSTQTRPGQASTRESFRMSLAYTPTATEGEEDAAAEEEEPAAGVA